jgi:hypothetical protein
MEYNDGRRNAEQTVRLLQELMVSTLAMTDAAVKALDSERRHHRRGVQAQLGAKGASDFALY